MYRWKHLTLTITCLLLIVGSVFSTPELKEENQTEKKKEKKDKKEEKEIDPKTLQDRVLGFDAPPIDQLAIESGPSYAAVAPPPYQGGDHGGGAPYPEPIPVPLPLPVQPGSIVLPSLPFNKGGGFVGGGHGGGFGGGGHGGGFGGGFGGGGHGGGFGGGGHDGGFGGEGQGGGYASDAVPPPIVHKQPHAPLTRSSNPSPVVSHGEGSQYHPPPPPPPPPQLPPHGYAPPPSNYVPPSDNSYSAPSVGIPNNNYAPPPNEIHNLPSVPADVYNAPQIHAAPLIHHHGDVDSRESFDHAHQSISNIHETPVSNYQFPQQLGIPSSGFGGPGDDISGSAYVPPTSLIADEPWTTAKPDLPQIANINVKCEKNLMRVLIEFDRPFYGIIFSKGHYSNVNCVHLPAGLGKLSSTFDISINYCGTIGNTDSGHYGLGGKTGAGTYFENTLVIQYDPQVQEVWDQARKLRCTWHDQYEKSVTFKPFPVDMLDVVRADFAGDNVGCWMQIQVGKGPWASEVSGLVKIGQAMTMVLAIKDEDNKFDMLVRNCMAHDGKRAPIQLVDQRGCVTRPKLMSRFTKIKNFGASASVLSYAHFQAFKFPDSMEVHFQCTIQICRFQCPEQCSDSFGIDQPGTAYDVPGGIGSGPYRRKRAVNITNDEEQDIGVNRIIQVVSTRDLGFLVDKKEIVKEIKESERGTLISSIEDEALGLICMSTPGFAATLVVLLSILVISCLLSAFLCLRYRGNVDTQSIISSYQNPAFLHKKRFF